MADPATLFRLLCCTSPAFPTGGFAYSHGLEWAVQAGDITDAASLADTIVALLQAGSARTDAILLRHAYRAPDAASLQSIIDLATCVSAGRERRQESLDLGRAFAASTRAWSGAVPDTLTAPDAPYPVAFAVWSRLQNIAEEDACLAYLTAFSASLVSAAVRLVPLGQSDGLAVTAGLEPQLLATLDETRDAGLDDIGTACFAADIASLRHETQYSRMFRT